MFRQPRTLAAAAVIAVLVVSATLFHQASPRPGNSATLPATFDMFGRIDGNSAWAESGADLYITRDGGTTWTKGTIPGGSALLSESLQPDIVQATGSGNSAEPVETATPAGFDHFYPVFLDADHGWLLSWTVSCANVCVADDWSLTVWRTSDGARSWQSAKVPGTYKGYGTLQFTDTKHGWMTISRMDVSSSSTNGPGLELATPAPTPTPVPLPSDQTTVLSTSDGGATWSPASTLAAMAFFSFAGSTEAWGYGTGDSGAGALDLVLHSVDGARTWTKSELPLPAGYSMVGIGQEPEADGDLVKLRVEATATGPFGGVSDTPNAAYSSPAYEILTFVSSDAGTTWKLDATRAVPGEYPNLMTTVTGIYLQAPRSQPIAVSEQNWVSGGPYGVFYGQGLPATSDTFQATFDGGVSWLSYPTKGLPGSVGMAQWTSPEDVWVMSSASSMGGYGGSSYIYTTRDSGNTWTGLGGAPAWPASPQPTMTPQIVGPDYSFDVPTAMPQFAPAASVMSMGRVDANVGWAAIASPTGNELRMTTDGGATWSEPRPLPAAGEIQFIDESRGWLVDSTVSIPIGSSKSLDVFTTNDGGRSWTQSAVDMGSVPDDVAGSSGGWNTFVGIHFRDATDGAVYWTVAYAQGADAYDMTKWKTVCTQASTADGGSTWSAPEGEAPCGSQVRFNTSSEGYAQSWDGGPTVYVTSDGGQTWMSGTLPAGNSGTPGNHAPSSTVLVLETRSDGLLHALVNSAGSINLDVSSDSGKSWKETKTGVGLPATTDYRVGRLGEGSWIALPTYNGPASTVMSGAWSTVDGGLTWLPLAATGLEPAVNVAFVSSTDGWVVGQSSVCETTSDGSQGCTISSDILATSDGGQTWRTILTP